MMDHAFKKPHLCSWDCAEPLIDVHVSLSPCTMPSLLGTQDDFQGSIDWWPLGS